MYEINIALNGKHFFATHERSLTDQRKMLDCLKVFKEKFPESEGYSITVSEIVKYSKPLNIDNLLEE